VARATTRRCCPPPGAGTIHGITYDLPDTGTADNFVEARGQQVLLPSGKYQRCGCSAPRTTATSPPPTATAAPSRPLALTDWAAGSGRNGNTVESAMDHRIKAGQGVDGPPVQLFAPSCRWTPPRRCCR
jgi:hypothetical protein